MKKSRAVALGVSVSCALSIACAGGDPPAVSGELADEIQARYESGAGTGGSGGSGSGVGGSSAATAAGSSAGGRGGAPAVADGAGGGALAGAAGAGTGTGGASDIGSRGGAAGTGGSAGAVARCDGFAVLAANCGSSGCHGEGSNLETFAVSEQAARAFIGKPGTLACTGQGTVIDPDNPGDSLMVRKLSDDPPCGQSMPLSGSPLSASESDCIESWIGGL